MNGKFGCNLDIVVEFDEVKKKLFLISGPTVFFWWTIFRWNLKKCFKIFLLFGIILEATGIELSRSNEQHATSERAAILAISRFWAR